MYIKNICVYILQEETRMADFNVSPTEKLSVPTMHQHVELAYVESSELNCKMIGMPYKV